MTEMTVAVCRAITLEHLVPNQPHTGRPAGPTVACLPVPPWASTDGTRLRHEAE